MPYSSEKKHEAQPCGDPQWVRDMHRHVDKTGEYRARDLERLLGDPRKSVAMPCTDFAPNHASDKKPK